MSIDVCSDTACYSASFSDIRVPSFSYCKTPEFSRSCSKEAERPQWMLRAEYHRPEHPFAPPPSCSKRRTATGMIEDQQLMSSEIECFRTPPSFLLPLSITQAGIILTVKKFLRRFQAPVSHESA